MTSFHIISIHTHNTALLDAWQGAAMFARDPKVLLASSLTRQEYMERGPWNLAEKWGYFVEHVCSNTYYPSVSGGNSLMTT